MKAKNYFLWSLLMPCLLVFLALTATHPSLSIDQSENIAILALILVLYYPAVGIVMFVVILMCKNTREMIWTYLMAPLLMALGIVFIGGPDLALFFDDIQKYGYQLSTVLEDALFPIELGYPIVAIILIGFVLLKKIGWVYVPQTETPPSGHDSK